MGLIGDDIANEIRGRLSLMPAPVRIIHFTQQLNLEYGRETRQVLEELTVLSDKLSLEVYDFLLDKEKVAEYGVDKVPATAIRNGKDYGIRYYGMPAGYEFATLLDAILDVSRGQSGLGQVTRQKLGQISLPAHLEVFVTPT
jgi:alkyl hydroperoxide reductase subunit AhpF